MVTLTIYGIKNCDMMQKAFAWLAANGVAYKFHDYKTQGVDAALLKRALAKQGWEAVLNRRGTTWRALPEAVKTKMNDETALQIALANPSIIRRPMLVLGKDIVIGFDVGAWVNNFAIYFSV